MNVNDQQAAPDHIVELARTASRETLFAALMVALEELREVVWERGRFLEPSHMRVAARLANGA